MKNLNPKQQVRFITVDINHAGQRIDNFLLRELDNVPRSYVYRILRKGEVRVNKKRCKPVYKLKEGDIVRIPPLFSANKSSPRSAPESLLKALQSGILLEDDDLIFINKPSGLAVHGGSGIQYGLIESFRQLRPDLTFIELVHRLDKETSGIVMLAKNRETLLQLHQMMKQGQINKYYQTLIKGEWQGGRRKVTNQLQRQQGQKQKMQVLKPDSGTTKTGKESTSIFSPVSIYKGYSLMKVELKTGRMHQIRTQLADLRHPVLGDSQYGDFGLNRTIKKEYGLKRLFLHACHLQFTLKKGDNSKRYDCKIALPDDLEAVIKILETEN